jgi:Family of unknown function (DUF6049)
LAVNVYNALTTRTQFQAALRGGFYGSYYQPGGGPLSLNALPRDPNGGVDVDIPVNQPTGELSATGVYPVQVFLEDQDGVPTGKPLTTFIVYGESKDLSSLRLDVSFVLPLTGNVQISPLGAPGPLSAGNAAMLRADAADLARWHVPVTLRATLPALESLAEGDAADRTAVTDLRQAVAAGDELLPATALPVNIPELVGSGLTNDLSTQLSSGDAELGQLLGASPAAGIWAFDGDIDLVSLSALGRLGADEVALPDSDLSTLPLSDLEFTFAQPTKLSVQGAGMVAVGADTELSARVAVAATPGMAVLVANQFLAELAMIDLERPSDQRGVVIIPPQGVAVSPVFLAVVLAGLQGNPLVQAVDLRQLFKEVPLAPSASGGPLVRQLAAPSRAGVLEGVGQLQRALADVAADTEVYGDRVPLVKSLDQELFVSLSSAFGGPQRALILAGVLRVAGTALRDVRLPPAISITLTSRQGSLPLTLVSAATSPVRVRLVLTSQQLSFLAATFAEGSCEPVNATKSAEHCQLTLSQRNTVLRIPVVARTPGAFPLSLQIETPSGDMVLRTSTGSVTSTAISDVGWFLMVGAALFLAVWWVRNARHGRRAHQLVPRPDDEPGSPGNGPVNPGAAVDGVAPEGPGTHGAPLSGAHTSAAPTSGTQTSGAHTSAAPTSGAPGSGATAPEPGPAGSGGTLAVSDGGDTYPGKHVLRPPR